MFVGLQGSRVSSPRLEFLLGACSIPPHKTRVRDIGKPRDCQRDEYISEDASRIPIRSNSLPLLQCHIVRSQPTGERHPDDLARNIVGKVRSHWLKFLGIGFRTEFETYRQDQCDQNDAQIGLFHFAHGRPLRQISNLSRAAGDQLESSGETMSVASLS